VADLRRANGITEQTYYRWKAEYGGMELSEMRRLKQLHGAARGGGPPTSAGGHFAARVSADRGEAVKLAVRPTDRSGQSEAARSAEGPRGRAPSLWLPAPLEDWLRCD